MSVTKRAWAVWGVGVLAYAVAVFHRTSLGVAAEPAKERFAIGAATLSALAVTQLIMYAAWQIPVGVLVDRFGSRLIIAAGALVMAGGQALLALTVDPVGALSARMLVGTGDAMTFICVLRLIPAWFPPGQIPVITQLTGLLGQAGQVASTIPLVAALAGPGWTPTYLAAAAVGVLAAGLVLAAVRNAPAGSPPALTGGGWRSVGRELAAALRHPGTRLGLWSHFTAQFSGMVFALLWGYPFMTIGLGYPPGRAGVLLTSMVVAATVVGPVLGRLTADFPLRRSNLVLGVVGLTIALWTLVLLWPGPAPLPVFVILVLVLSAYGPASAVGFDFARTFNPATRLGAATGIVNMGGFVASLITIFAIGVILDLRPAAGYDLADFKAAFAFQYVMWALGLVGLWRTRRLARAELAARGQTIEPLPRAIRRRLRHR